ncbi:MAG: DUF4136 domain-containing protein [Bacteroidota bacterium]
MKLKSSLILLVVIGITSCSPRVVGIYNEGVGRNAKSFMVVLPEEEKELSEEQVRLDKKIQQIIENSLTNKGLKNSLLPELYVSYIISVHTASDTQGYDYTNYNRYNYYNYYNNPYTFRTTSHTHKEGVFIIDIRNEDNKLVWQGSREFRLRSKEGIPDVLPEICSEVIVEFDPKH